MKHLHLALAVSLLLAGCGTPAAGPLGGKLLITQAPAARPALVSVPAPASRVLAEGAFTLPASLVSIGSGGLVSIGSGGLVSIGSGGLVSIGSGGYKVLAADAADVAVPGAVVALARPYGEAVDPAWEVAPAQTGADGGYSLHGRAPAGLYRVAATASGHTFFTLVAVTTDAPAQAAVDAATTMVAAKLLAEHPGGDLAVLPMQAFGASVAAVRAAIAADGLPAGFTPARAAEAMADLERRDPAVAGAMQGLRDRQAGLERREDAFGYRLQELAATLGVPAQVVEEELRAALSAAPEATDAEIDAEVTTAVRRRTEAPTPAPSAIATPAPDATPAAGATPAPAASAEAPAAGEDASPAAAPAATPAEGATEDDAAIDKAMAKEARRAQKKHQPTPAPSAAPSDDEASTPPGDEGDGDEIGGDGEGTGTGGETDGGDGTGEQPGTGNAGNNGNAGGNGNAGNGTNAGGNGNAGGTGNGNANGQNGTQGQGNGGSNNGNGGATNGNGTGNGQ